VRLRKEYLYRKSLEGKDKDEYEKKQAIRKSLRGYNRHIDTFVKYHTMPLRLILQLVEGKALPTELHGDEERLRHEIELEDISTAKPKVLISFCAVVSVTFYSMFNIESC
jgi:U3 small nucleolar ribonucleoprotein protein IMP4